MYSALPLGSGGLVECGEDIFGASVTDEGAVDLAGEGREAKVVAFFGV